VNIGFGPRVGYWAGWIVPPASPLILIAGHAAQADDVNRQLLRVGFDDVVGYVDGGFEAWEAADGQVSRVEIISARELRDRLRSRERLTLIDVRSPSEWQTGHIDEAVNIPVGELSKRAAELRRPDPVVTVCETGFRSSLAASLLVRAGVPAINVADGTSAYRLLD
jgi:hydroxyacylglutathione hydrolase